MGCSNNIVVIENKKKMISSSLKKKNNNSNSYISFEKQDIKNLNENTIIYINKNKNNKFKEKENYKKIMYEMHLKFRKLHGCSNKLDLDEFLNKLAQEYAKELTNSPKYLYYNNYTYKGEALGENIEISKGKIESDKLCNKWYKECENYKYNNKFQKETVHFTQMVWNNTKKVGFGFEMKDNIYYVVALYYPAGNIFNEFNNNVLKKIDDQKK